MALPPFDPDRDIPDLADSSQLPEHLAVEVDHLAGRDERWADAAAGLHPALRARALICTGRPSEAAELLAHTDDASTWSTQELAAAVWSVSRVHVEGLAEQLMGTVDSLRADFLCIDGTPLTPVESLRGHLAVARGDLRTAIAHFGAAVATGDARAPLWGARARLELARAEITAAHCSTAAGATAHLGAARRALVSARTFFAAGGSLHLLGEADRALQACAGRPHEGTRPPTDSTSGRPTDHTGGDPRGGAAPQPASGHLLHTSGGAGTARGSWVVGFGIQPSVEVPDRLGLHAVAELLRRPGAAIPAVLLEHRVAQRPARCATSRGPEDPDEPRTVLLDGLSAAFSTVGPDSVDLDALTTGDLAEVLRDDRARSRVSKLLRRTISSLHEDHRVLAEHLSATVSTGHVCAYEPSPGVRWFL
ncbi:MAG: hypothetical protein KDB31_11530 [Microthrixaceae bacterium]|nr:hypothetical protein [Microthrixaceae bacterium]